MAIDLRQAYYNTGTATVAANGTVVTGQGTSWLQAVRRGDLFGSHVGMPMRILSVDTNTQLTLAYPWQGPAQTATPYEVQFTFDDVTFQEAVRQLLEVMQSGNNEALAGLTGTAGEIPFFTGPGAMDGASGATEGQILGFAGGEPTWVDNVGYVEGEWTPSITFGGAGTGQAYDPSTIGTYTRIGSLVFVRFRVQLTNKGTSTGNAELQGLPFPVGQINGAITVGFYTGVSLQNAGMAGFPSAGTNITLRSQGLTTTTTLNHTNFTNTALLIGSLHYSVAP